MRYAIHDYVIRDPPPPPPPPPPHPSPPPPVRSHSAKHSHSYSSIYIGAPRGRNLAYLDYFRTWLKNRCLDAWFVVEDLVLGSPWYKRECRRSAGSLFPDCSVLDHPGVWWAPIYRRRVPARGRRMPGCSAWTIIQGRNWPCCNCACSNCLRSEYPLRGTRFH